jgi:hypothetical protein
MEYAADRIELKVSRSALSSVFNPTSPLFTRRITASTDSRGSSVEATALTEENSLDFERTYVIGVMPALCYQTTSEEEHVVDSVGVDNLEEEFRALMMYCELV